jgi:hypothetical protein
VERRVLWAREALAAMPHPIPCLQQVPNHASTLAFSTRERTCMSQTMRPCMSQSLPLSCKPCCACKRAHETWVRAWARVRCFVARRRCGEGCAERWPLSHVC